MIANFVAAISGMSPECLLLIIVGVIIGLIFGAIPGLSTTMAVALFLPITFAMKMNPSMSILMGLYIGGFSGGLISAILLNIPGTAASLMTCMDGHPMAAQGKAGKALGLGIFSSFLGGGISIVALILIAPLLANIALQFGAFEYFSLTFFALSIIVTMSSKDIVKGTISGLFGILVAMIGPAPIDTYPRFTFAEYWKEKLNVLRSSVIGILIGILPGIGGALASIISYNTAKRCSKTPEEYGKGCNGGLVASETANNAAIGGAMVPLSRFLPVQYHWSF